MPYRTPAQMHASDTAVCCRACGGLTSLAFAPSRPDRFACRSCGVDQAVLRGADELESEKLTLADHGIGGYDDLTPFAKEFGKNVQTGGLDLVCDGIAFKIGLNINSGTVMGLDHHASTTGLPRIRLLSELPDHVYAKERGVVKEVQTGDQAFDDGVYIESNVSDADVLTVLAPPAVRKAVLMLLSETQAIAIDERGVSAYVARDAGAFDPAGIRRRLALLRVIAGAPRPLVTEEVPEPPRAKLVKRLVGWAIPIGLFLFILGLAKWTPTDGMPVYGSLASGFAIAILMLPIWTVLLRGRSTSHREILGWRVTTFFAAPLFVTGVLLVINGAFDSSQERTVTMTIESSHRGEDDENFHTTTADERGVTHSYSFKTKPKDGSLLKVGWKEGALGWTWQSSDAIVVEAQKP